MFVRRVGGKFYAFDNLCGGWTDQVLSNDKIELSKLILILALKNYSRAKDRFQS